MYEIVMKSELNPEITLMKISAPRIANKAKPGQFILLRTDEEGERIPLTIHDTDKSLGTVTIIFQKVGKTTRQLGDLQEGESLHDFVGPLGRATELDGVKKAVIIGGGLGCAIAFPVAKALLESGADVTMIAGFKTKGIIILRHEMEAVSGKMIFCTDDGSYGRAGLVTDALKDLLENGEKPDRVFAFGPLIMMKFVSETTRGYGIPTTVSMNPIMVDGTGMCGGCRVTVGGETKFACVDGPDFDGHLVDFDRTIARNRAYREHEMKKNREYQCRLEGMNDG